MTTKIGRRNEMLTFGSLFSGIGGFDLGLERAGWVCRWQVEIDPFCQKVLAKHWPDVRRFGDVRGCGKHNLEAVDLVCGGFPCQPHSVAGQRKGAEDDRNLWPEFLRIVRELRPTWVLAENVPGIVSLYLDTVLSDLESEDYTCWTFDIPACAFNAPHLRRRIFVVAYAQGQRETATQQLGSGRSPITSREDVADPDGTRQLQPQRGQQKQRERTGDSSHDVSHPDGQGLQGRGIQGPVGDGGKTMAHANGQQAVGSPVSWEECNPWAVEPGVGRVVDGVPNRVDRVRSLGNAVVPQVAEFLGVLLKAEQV